MKPETKPISPLRQRMIDDMHMRQYSPKTQVGYAEDSSTPYAFNNESASVS